ncbi:hypothetical protein [Microseira sp. BLCC-F43]|uniref:hypothetical protein n=1 Tax=Microseira sp. BLCC-F43 TaxID=3153602 RepID=UPI0035B74E85
MRNYIIRKWESQDEPEHLRTIRDRILRNSQRAGRLLGIYQQILQSDPPLAPPWQGGGQEQPPLARGAGGIWEPPLARGAGGIWEPPLARGAGGIWEPPLARGAGGDRYR